MCIPGFNIVSHEIRFSLSRSEAIQRKESIYFFLELDSAVIGEGDCVISWPSNVVHTFNIWMEFRDTITIFDSIIGKRLSRVSPNRSYRTRFESIYSYQQHFFTGNVVWGIESNKDVIKYINKIMQDAIDGNYDAKYIVFREFSKDRIFNLIKGIYYEKTVQDIVGFPMFFINMEFPDLCAYFGIGDLTILEGTGSVYAFLPNISFGDFPFDLILSSTYSYSPVVDIYFNVGEVIWEFSDIIRAFPKSVTDKWYSEIKDFILTGGWSVPVDDGSVIVTPIGGGDGDGGFEVSNPSGSGDGFGSSPISIGS